MTKKIRVFSGIQPTGKLHVGNYTGALSTWVAQQDNFEGIYCVVDLHALTIPENVVPAKLNEKVWKAVSIYLAAGLDPKKSDIFIQSMVPEHSELAWILNCVTPMGWLNRMTQFKAKSANRENVGTGLFTYPTLMAADILLYDAEKVPAGDDQKQHIELTRDIAERFNTMFGKVFTIPEPMIGKAGARIMGLDDPSKKMSKSVGEVTLYHSIGIVDEPDLIAKSIKKAKTDLGPVVVYDTAGEGVRNLLNIYQAVTKETDDQVKEKFEGKGYGFLKKEVTEAVCEVLAPVRQRYLALMEDRAYLKSVVNKGAEHAHLLASKKVSQVRDALGISFSSPNLEKAFFLRKELLSKTR